LQKASGEGKHEKPRLASFHSETRSRKVGFSYSDSNERWRRPDCRKAPVENANRSFAILAALAVTAIRDNIARLIQAGGAKLQLRP
jgi:hypothetical protein